jgi:hypothetical protein
MNAFNQAYNTLRNDDGDPGVGLGRAMDSDDYGNVASSSKTWAQAYENFRRNRERSPEPAPPRAPSPIQRFRARAPSR